MFKYKDCTQDELIEHIKSVPATNISRIKRYYLDKGELDVVKAIDKARHKIQMQKLLDAEAAFNDE
jgi:hypothetical protein